MSSEVASAPSSEISKKKINANSTVVTAIAGLLASSAGKSVMHPIDTIKAKLQVITLPENLIGGGEMKSGGEVFKP